MAAREPLPPGFDKLLDDLYFRLEERDRWAEHIIRFLLAANGGGIAVVMAYAGVLTNLGRPVTGLFLGLLAFSIGLWLVGVQLWTAAHFVRVGRQKLRPLMEKMVKKSLSYEEVFLAMGDKDEFPSKWKWFRRLTMGSFALFVAGLLLSFLSVANIRILGA